LENELSIAEITGLIGDGTIREYNLPKYVTIEMWQRHEKKLKSAFVYRAVSIMENADREIEVLFLEGKSGTGKTTLAKRVASGTGNGSYYISGSSNDPMEGYKGQDTLILDDLRDDAFKFADLLKILDNHTASLMKSRFTNKQFIGRCIIITSYKPLDKWYENIPIEAKSQFYRRITNLYKFDVDEITEYELDEQYNEVFIQKLPNYILLQFAEEREKKLKRSNARIRHLLETDSRITNEIRNYTYDNIERADFGLPALNSTRKY
jgi:hypothetical protein